MSDSVYRPTPRMTRHARDRCREMGISTKVAKAIVRYPDLVRPGNPGSGMSVATCDRYPDYAVVFMPSGEEPVVLTVLYHGQDIRDRSEAVCSASTKGGSHG